MLSETRISLLLLLIGLCVYILYQKSWDLTQIHQKEVQVQIPVARRNSFQDGAVIMPGDIKKVFLHKDEIGIPAFDENTVYPKPGDDNFPSSECDLLNNITLKEFFSVVNVSSENVFLMYPLKPKLSYRALCSVESWALNHQNASIWYTFTVKTLQDPDAVVHKLLSQYSNIKFIYVDLQKVFDGTPLSKLSPSAPWNKSKWPGTQLSDLLRQAMVWHKGGYYSDTDVYPVKSLNMLRNFISLNLGKRVGPSLLHFDAHHPYVKTYMEIIANDYQPYIYVHHGPIAGQKAAIQLCNFLALQTNESYRDCTVDGHTFRFLSEEYCIYCRKDCFKPGLGKKFKKDAYCFHTHNSGSRKRFETFTSKSYMHVMAEKNCPFIFKQAQLHSNFW